MSRPEFLLKRHENGNTIVASFVGLASVHEKREIERWLNWANCYGSMTWQEQHLFSYLNDCDEL